MANVQGGKSADDAKKGTKPAESGGRSEQQAEERNREQAKTGHDKSAEVPREGVHNVKSEPHWDPAEPPAERGAQRK